MLERLKVIERCLERIEHELFADKGPDDAEYPEDTTQERCMTSPVIRAESDPLDDILDGRAQNREEEARAMYSAVREEVDKKSAVLGKIAVLSEQVANVKSALYYHSNENDDQSLQTRRMIENLHSRAIHEMEANRRWIEELGRLLGVEVYWEESTDTSR